MVLEKSPMYELCEELASKRIGGFCKDGNSVYIDPFGCGLEISLAKNRDGRFVDLKVFFGEREVFSEESFQNDHEYVDEGHWADLVWELNEYEKEQGNTMMEELPYISHTLIDICKREANVNRAIMKQLRKKIFDVLSEYGNNTSEDDDDAERYVARFEDNGDVYTFGIRIRDCGRSALFVRWDKRLVFSYDWIGGIDMDENGRGKLYRGKWERFLLKVWRDLDRC